MAKTDEFWYEDQVLKTYVEEDIAVIKVKCNVFDAITDLAESGKFISFFTLAERNSDIKALLLMNEGGCLNEEEYDRFLQRLVEKERDPDSPEDEKPIFESLDRTRQINVLNRVITQLVDFKKISVLGFQGNVVTPFFGAGLAADFRFASEDVSFSLVHLKYGIHPGGALPFFLPHYVGHAKAVEILLKGETLSAQQASELGLVTDVFPNQDYEKRCLQEIHKLCHLDQRVILTTKLLLNFSRAELHDYFDTESALLH
jgi:2-(1,2-epoxy-1,2-dihydrophenyl)acetyl-CoA isomerase